MEKYLYKYWQTFPKYNSIDGQLDRFAKVCVVSVSNPQKVLDIIPIWGKKMNLDYVTSYNSFLS